MNKISVIIPTYNGSKFIYKTLESALNQDYHNFEVIVIDDYSTDDSVEIVTTFMESYTNLELIKNDRNMGISKTINTAVSIASGEYLVFLGHDDLIEKKHLSIMYSEMNNNNAIMVHCNSNVIDSEDNFMKKAVIDAKQIVYSNNAMYTLSKINFVHNVGYIVNKKIYVKYNQFGKYKNYGEWLSWIEFAKHGKIYYTNKVFSYYRRHETNITNTFSDLNVIKDMQIYSRECRKKAKSFSENNLYKNLIYLLNYFYYEIIYFLRIFKRKLKL